MSMDKVFEALSSQVRRKVLAYLSATDLTAGEIAERFDISKPSVSKHLSILENAGLIRSERKGQFIHYSLVSDNLVNTLTGFVQEVCPVGRPLRKESRDMARGRRGGEK
ncbi:metalloregulator ArsR/SmtB family transcription factor [Dongia rigui]|uniref:Metalloregulator ArsR/SmtB family transcription factor n=1 Tax=Dongia rigui TaxID=940149 RepID=A0ABU5E2U9_9PROT|nr:metalloregulator ArsR/SmtB family transcription factor [Dongia rigui]MDY0873515.1 metalloregulator ArsR/SmtB family transcription factor [Dongia rigui]